MLEKRIRCLCLLSLLSVLLAGCYVPTLDDILMQSSSAIKHTPDEFGYSYQQLELSITEDRSIIIWHVFSQQSKALICVIPGSGANKAYYAQYYLPIFVDNGYDLILMDYEGFGDSSGQGSLEHAVDDAFAAAVYARAQHETVVCFGISLGTALVARLASEMDFSACMFEATLVMSQEARLWLQQAGLNLPLLWAIADAYIQPQVPQDYDILKYITEVTEPKLFMHSRQDRTTPYSGGLLVYEAASDPKEFWTMTGDHAEMVQIDLELYAQTVISWLDRTLGSPESEDHKNRR